MQLITGKTKLDKNLFIPIKNDYFKPNGGLWSSTYLPGNKYKSDWIDWCKRENYIQYDLDSGILFNFKKNVNGYTISSNKDIINLYDIIGKNPNDLNNNFFTLNYENLAKQFDFLLLTKKGLLDVKYGFYNINDIKTIHYTLSFYDWDYESTLILNFDCIDLNSIRYFKDNNYDCFENIDTLEQMKICHKCILKDKCNLIAIKESI